MLVIRRIHVSYKLDVDGEHREAVDRVHAMHHPYCPVYRTLHGCIRITTDYELFPARP